MKFGIAIRNMGPQADRATIRDCARAAEELGFDGLFVSDHLCIPPNQTEGSDGIYLDVLSTLAYLAGITERIRLGVSVLVLPYRPAVLTAKMIATVQALSEGRMVVGTGVGWMKEEFASLGVDFTLRGALTDDTLAVLHHLFDPGRSQDRFEGRVISFDPFVFQPRPPRPPIWVGGNGKRAMERAIALGDGWHPMLSPSELAPAAAAFKAAAATAGRKELEIVVRRAPDVHDTGRLLEAINRDREAGATYYILDLKRYADSGVFIGGAEKFVTTVMG